MVEFCWVVEKWTIMCGEVVLGGKWSGEGLAFSHGVAVKKIQRVFERCGVLNHVEELQGQESNAWSPSP
ncbi:unnamed protein product [Prunus armeniaca]|uniref:Uncharacterized protein n=1 Tax=Prunus armeniaca TaxID=36596 RepID=A0A6J5WFR6_PRUAR|nr:unnamed protein product [Prunus armeniaca]CAB4299241.1 unnamed protein product [Prunus armeniaca]